MVFLVSSLFSQEGKPFKAIWDEIGRIWDAIFELQDQVGGEAGFPQPNFNSGWIDFP